MGVFSVSRHIFYGGVVGACFLFVLVPQQSDAALLYLDPASAEINRGDTITMAVRIDTDEGECINTADVVISYGNSIKAADVSRGESILNVWVEEPTINTDSNTVTFAGGIPGGYCGRVPGDPKLTNILAEIIFRSPGLSIGDTSDSAHIQFDDASRVLLNDGFGTEASLRTSDALLTLSDGTGTTQQDDWSKRIAGDEIPPAPFSISLNRSKDAFSGKYFISFNTQDKQSGIDRYEVIEEPFEDFGLFKWGRVDAPWREAKSPHILKDQTLNSTIRVRAIDKAGNQTLATLVPEPALRSLSYERIATIVTIVVSSLIIAGIIFYGLYRRKQRMVKQYEHEGDDNL